MCGLTDMVPQGKSAGTMHMEESKPWRENNERYFNETVTRSRCTFRTPDKKMEP